MSDVTGIKTRGIFRNTFHTERCQLLPSESMTSEICHQLIIHSVCPLNPLLTESGMAFAGREAAPPTLCLLAACSALSNPSSIGNSQTAVFSLDNSAGVHVCDMALPLSLSLMQRSTCSMQRGSRLARSRLLPPVRIVRPEWRPDRPPKAS